MRPNPLLLLPLTLLLGAAPERIPLPGPVPTCRRGEFLTIKDGVLRCRDLIYPTLKRTLKGAPDCTGRLAGPPAQGTGSWQCADKGHVDAGAVAALPSERVRAEAARQAAERLLAEQASAVHYVGVTAQKTTGLVRRTGTPAGLLSANALCADEYPGSHLCTGYEVSAAVASGEITQASLVPRAWIYHPSWKTPLAGAKNPEEGLADSCASYTYGQDDRGWSGIAMEWRATVVNAVEKVLVFQGGSSAPCSAMLPLGCCK
ncbi:MAG: hypothetical protein U1A78_26920 [Polyangia bacterium]